MCGYLGTNKNSRLEKTMPFKMNKKDCEIEHEGPKVPAVVESAVCCF